MLAERKGSLNVSGKKDFIKSAFMMICICCNQGFLTVFNMDRFIFVPQLLSFYPPLALPKEHDHKPKLITLAVVSRPAD